MADSNGCSRKISKFLMVVSLLLLAPAAWSAGSVDAGRTVFNSMCLGCHGAPATSSFYTPYRFNANALTTAFTQISDMNAFLALGAQTINDIATYLGLPDSNDTDRLLDWGEDTFPTLLTPARQPTQQYAGYTYRFYPTTGVYVGTKDGYVWYLDGSTAGAPILNLGTMRTYLDQMPNGR